MGEGGSWLTGVIMVGRRRTMEEEDEVVVEEMEERER